MALAVRLRSAVALLGGFPVLAGADLDVHPGEVVLLQGANGAGKTSLLRTCAGLLVVVSGTAEVLGCDLTLDRRAVRRRVGLMGHATSLYDDLTVEDNVRFGVRAAGGDAAAIEPALVRLGLGGRLRSVPVGRLSAGQRRRTGLAILVARRPELWLLDEPHAGLDAEHRDLLDDLIRDAVAEGAAVVMASHERDRASALAHRTLTMAGGTIVPSATAAPPAPSARTSPSSPLPSSLSASSSSALPPSASSPSSASSASYGSAGEHPGSSALAVPGPTPTATTALPSTADAAVPAGIYPPLEVAHVA
jgi:heme ABC exporter ATP-binding subunit CcmA